MIKYLFGQWQVKVLMKASPDNFLKDNHTLILTLETVWQENHITTILYPKGKILTVPNNQLKRNRNEIN